MNPFTNPAVTFASWYLAFLPFFLYSHSLRTDTGNFPWEPSSTPDFFPLNLLPSSTDPCHLSQNYLPLLALFFIESSFLFYFSYPSWAGILAVFHITKDRAKVLILCIQGQGALPTLPLHCVPPPWSDLLLVPKPVPKLHHMLSQATWENLLNQSSTRTGLPGSTWSCDFHHSLHLLFTLFMGSSSSVTPTPGI